MSGWSSQVIVATQVIIEGVGDFLLVYNGPPANGNLILSIAPLAGTDSFNNAFVSGMGLYQPGFGLTDRIDPANGFTSYTATAYSQMSGAGIVFGSWNPNTQVLTPSGARIDEVTDIGAPNHQGYLTVRSPAGAGNDNLVSRFQSGNQNVATGQPNTPRQILIDFFDLSPADLWLSGSILKCLQDGSAAYTWQNVANSGITLGTGWASNLTAGGAQDIQLRLGAEDNLIITGTAHTTSATPAANIFTLVAPYVPKVLQRQAILTRTGGVNTMNLLSISAATGNVSLVTALAAANIDVYFNVSVPLGNIA